MRCRFPLRAILVAAWLGAAMSAFAQQLTAPAAAVRFASVDVYIDTDVPVAAWQFELSERNGIMTVVGVENGDSEAFDDAPYFDIDAVGRGAADRIIVADFSLRQPDALPVGSARIATVHVRLTGAVEPDYVLRLITAGDASGAPIEASMSIRES